MPITLHNYFGLSKYTNPKRMSNCFNSIRRNKMCIYMTIVCWTTLYCTLVRLLSTHTQWGSLTNEFKIRILTQNFIFFGLPTCFTHTHTHTHCVHAVWKAYIVYTSVFYYTVEQVPFTGWVGNYGTSTVNKEASY